MHLTEQDLAAIARIKAFAERIENLNVAADVMFGRAKPPGDKDGYHAVLSIGYRVVFSIDLADSGALYKHLSLSCRRRPPDVGESIEIARAFGIACPCCVLGEDMIGHILEHVQDNPA
jgi:hypothetical protein